MNKHLIIVLVILFSGYLQGQGFYPFKYHIIMDTVPDQYIIYYSNKDTNAIITPPQIKLVVVDTYCATNYHGFVIKSPDTIFYVDMFDTNCVEFKYYPYFKIKQARTGTNAFYMVTDTGLNCRISQITVVLGMHSFLKQTIYSKYPLTRKKVHEIRQYVFYKGAEPICVTKKRCYISLPEI